MRGCWVVGMYEILVRLLVGPGIVAGGGSGGSTGGA